ncbi:MAG: outer membrane beta-barrel protein [Pseudomonadota bacterium]
MFKPALTFACSCAAFVASAQAGGIYLQLHGGVNAAADEISIQDNNFIGEVSQQSLDASDSLGFTGGGLFGTYILPFIALEGELTMRTDPAQEISVAAVEAAVEEELTTYAAMLNGVVRPSLPLLPDPYVGVGLGYLQPSLELPSGANPQGRMAYQVKAGVSMGLLPGLGQLGVEASYLATDDLSFTEELAQITDEEFSYGGVTGLVTWRLGF